MGTGSNYAIEVAEQQYLEAREKWIRGNLGPDDDESSPVWKILEEEYDVMERQRLEHLEMSAEAEAERKSKIRSFVEELGLPALVHFTQVSNLESILENGLHARDNLPDGVDINDLKRLDGRENTISTSIAFPNSRMFYKYRNEKGGNWCVIGISKRVLWELDCLFCRHNAADIRISRMPDHQLSTIDAFQDMYREMAGLDSRETQSLRSYDPTDEQAEVLIRGHIPSKYIVGVVFADKPSRARFEEALKKRKVILHSKNKGYFASRSYVRR